MLSLAAAGQRLSRFLQRELLSVVVPGVVSLVGGYLLLFYGGAESTTHGGLSGIFGFLAEQQLPSGALALSFAVVLLAYSSYLLGAWSRLLSVWLAGLVPPRPSYLRDIWSAKANVADVFGKDAVNDALNQHLLSLLPEDYPDVDVKPSSGARGSPSKTTSSEGGSASGRRRVARRRGSQDRLHHAKSEALASLARKDAPDPTSLEYLRVEAIYCKVWLARSDWRHLRIDFYEFEINLLYSLIVPVALVGAFGVKYFGFVSTYEPLPRWLTMPIIFAAASTFAYRVVKSAKERESFENFDAIRNLLFSELLTSAPTRNNSGP